ncbi:PD-(D/E)XK motif protein [Paracoccus salsus]|uniref:PD-(D/E)XK motif protein n=1 Tax=Paracoccus salsus TaxID=2911061 RepID=UPI001F20AA1E|nr:PD-(D/E)XK motif protein [Paracoccus salsus]MCF3972099.1 PD-(D/E)XK motif protein [Paracoccus salsus]
MLPADANDIRTDIVLRSVDVEFSRLCTIETEDDQEHNGCYTIIRLKEADPDIVRLFVKILEERFLSSARMSNPRIAESIQEVASLFSQIDGSPRDQLGLWGELFAITQSNNVDDAVRSWSSQKTAKYDFVTETFVLDVKTTLSSTPKHRFALDQLRPAGSYEAYILSLCVVELPAGRTVGELMDAIGDQIADNELRSAFLRQCLVKGGKDIYQSNLKLQAYPEEDSFQIYSASDIPVPAIDAGSPIHNVRFDVDLTNLAAVTRGAANTVLLFGGG